MFRQTAQSQLKLQGAAATNYSHKGTCIHITTSSLTTPRHPVRIEIDIFFVQISLPGGSWEPLIVH